MPGSFTGVSGNARRLERGLEGAPIRESARSRRFGVFAMMIGKWGDPGRTSGAEFGQRRFTRFPVAVAVTGQALQFPDQHLRGTVRDIGRGGLMAEFPVELVPGSQIQLSLNMPSGPIQDTGRVIWAARLAQLFRHGVAFPEVKPRDFGVAVTPAEDSRRAPSRSDRAPAVDPSGRRRAVLIVDDDAQLLEVASLMLEVAGYRPLAACDGREALGHLQREAEVGVVLLNLHLPGEDTAELYDRIRLVRPEMPVLLTSGEPEESALARFRRPGLAGFLYKPAGIPAWVARIEEIFAASPNLESSAGTSPGR
jgi:CheY-like chemotaxis protein